MSYFSRLSKAFQKALHLPLSDCSQYVLISDCHRGTGTSNDNFLKNRNLYFAALSYYYQKGFTYIELGDGDELWENRSIRQIQEAHEEVFELLSQFQQHNRFYPLYGNHDMIRKKTPHYYEGIILESKTSSDVYLTHGHQADLWNSTFWKITRSLVRFLWKPLERFGILDPTSTAKNYKRKKKTEKRLQAWAKKEKHILITGHTHRPVLSEKDLSYCNCGSCVHPYGMTCLEIEHKKIRLVKWTLSTKTDMSLYVTRKILVDYIPLSTYSPQ